MVRISGRLGTQQEAAGKTATSAVMTTTGINGTAVRTRVFAVDELAHFDGRDGRRAYVAVDGTIYDVSDSPRWPQGGHADCDLGAMAGRELSWELAKAPTNMRTLVERMPVVGILDQP